MRAIVHEEARGITLRERERPDPGQNEALIRVHRSSLCGSDIHAYHRANNGSIPVPRIIGHEFSGTVEQVGNAVNTVRPEDFVIGYPNQYCGECEQCRMGQNHICPHFECLGIHRDGSFADYLVLDERFVHRIPQDVTMDRAGLIEPLSVCCRAIFGRSGAAPGDIVLVQGPGPIGTLTAIVLKHLGAKVVVTGLEADRRYRLPLIESFDISTVTLDRDDADERLDEFSNGCGYDVVYDTTGHVRGPTAALSQVRNGGEIVVVGLPSESSQIRFGDLVRGEVDIKPSFSQTPNDVERAITLIQNRSLDVDRVIDQSFSLTDANEAFEAFEAGTTTKPMFVFS